MKLPIRVRIIVFLTSLTLLCYEVSLIRIFSIIQLQNFFSIIISMAMLGFGISGSLLFLLRKRLKSKTDKWIQLCLIMYPITLFLGFIVSSKLPFNPFLLGYENIELLYLFISFLCIVIPFIFGSSIFGILFQKHNIHKLYSLNLVGSGTGAFVVILIQFILHPFDSLIFVTALSFLTAIIYSTNFGKRTCLGVTFVSLIFSIFTFLSFDLFNLKEVSEFKPISQTLTTKDARILYEKYSPYGLVQVVEAPGLRSFPGLSILCPYDVPNQKMIYFDGSGSSPVIPLIDNYSDFKFLTCMTSALPYYIRNISSTLVAGSGGGEGIVRALYFGSEKIYASEIDPNVVGLMKNELLKFSGGIYIHPNVNVSNSDIRSYVKKLNINYSLIELSFIDSFSATSSGVNSLNESYIYTVESLSELFEKLNTSGFISITRWTVDPPRDNIKLLATAIESLRTSGIDYIGNYIVAIRSLQTFTLLISKSPISIPEIHRVKEFSSKNLFDLVYYPGIKAEEANRFIRLAEPYYYEAAMELLSDNYDSYIKNHTFNIEPASDNRPYFYNFFKIKTLEHIKEFSIKWIPITDWGYLTLLLVLIFVIILSLLGVLLPTQLSTQEPITGKVFLYFSLLGLSYFFIEITLIQKSILYIGNPIYATSSIIAGLLIFSGIGSYFSDKVKIKKAILYSVILIILSLILFLYLYRIISNYTVHWNSAFKIILMLFCVFPLGFAMGIPFPKGLELIKTKNPNILPWAWGVNGFFSVISILLTSILSIVIGFNIVFLIACLFYLIAGIISLEL